ncbi:MAG: MATE family efflux transporter [Phocaeicola sp.]|nr:MATE family efflux transporter [Phocaeicola sp.]MDD7449254.1 MATE family efflux transporter [Prevotellaceae bacterium]MDY5938393.1 MATE family efflux transporter [Phocaeicola sp.]
MATMREMTEGKSLPLLLKFTVPLLLGNLLQQTYSLIDAAIVGQFLGIHALASIGASTSVVFLIFGFCNGCCNGFAIPVAQKFGARDYDALRRYVYVSLKISIVISLFLAILTSWLCADILKLMKTPEVIFENAYWYLFIAFVGIPFTFFYNLLAAIMRALGDSNTPFWFLLFSTVLNILLDFFAILVLGWGVPGAAIATLVSQVVSALACYWYLMHRFDILHAQSDEKRYDGRIARTLLEIGVPMGLQFSITAIGSMMLQSANNALGTACVAAFTAAIRIKMFFLCVYESVGISIATYVGQNYGAGKLQRIMDGVKTAFMMMMVYSLFVGVLLWFTTEQMVMLFVDASEIEVIEKATLFMHVAAVLFPLLGTLCLFRSAIQGMGYTKLAMISGVTEMFARTGVSIWAVPLWGFTAVAFGDSVAWFAADCFLLPTFFYLYRVIVARSQR